MADTGIDPANSRRGADTGWAVAHHRIGGANCRIHRDIVDADLDRAGSVRKSVDAGRSLRRAGERSLPDRMRNHGVDPRPDTVCSWLAQRAMRGLLRQENSRRRDEIAGHRIRPRRYIERERKDQPESEALGRKGGDNLHVDMAMNVKAMSN